MSFIEDYELTKNPKDLQLHTMEKRIIELEAERDKALKYAIDLATSLVKQHYPHVPYWEPDDNLYGVLMQIDNATTRWKKDVLKLEAENERLKEALKYYAEGKHSILVSIPVQEDDGRYLQTWDNGQVARTALAGGEG